MKLLITGVCGFVGSTLARSWLERDPSVEIFGLDNLIRPGSELNRAELRRRGVKLHHADIRVASDFETLPAVDWVVDAAANPSVLAGIDGLTSSRQLVEHNLLGTINLLEYCKSHRAGFVLLSTSRVYSTSVLSKVAVQPCDGAFRLSEDRPLPLGLTLAGVSEYFSTEPPVSLYGATKLASELLALEYGETFRIPVWINRCGVLAGAGQFGRADQGIFAYWINAWLRRQPLRYIGFSGTGYQVRDCLHPSDLLPILQKQTQRPAGADARIVNLAGGPANSISLAQLSAWCKERLGPHQVSAEPYGRPYDVPWLVLDSARAKEHWGWEPRTALLDILEEILVHGQKNQDWLHRSGVQ